MSVSRKENGSLVKKAGRAVVDLALSLTSNHAVANRVVTENLNQKVTKFSGTDSGNTYVTVDQLAYDETNKKLGLKVNGADTVIPFSSGSEIIYLGTGTSFNLQTLGITGWQKFTVNNFIVEMASSADSGQSGRTDCQHPRFTITPNKSYNSSTGVLTASISGYGWATNGAWYEHNSTSTSVKAYLVIGDIENV